MVNALDSGGQRLPYLGVDVALYVISHHLNDVGRMLISMGKKTTIGLGLFDIHVACLHLRAPYSHHTDIDTVLLSLFDDIIHVVPIAVHTIGIGLRQVPSCRQRGLSVDVIGWRSVHHLYQDSVEACRTAFLKVILCFRTDEKFGQQPARISQKEEWLSVLKLQVAMVSRHHKSPIRPRFHEG